MKISKPVIFGWLAAIVIANTSCTKSEPLDRTVQPPPIITNRPPMINAGSDITIDIPVTSTILSMALSDPDNNLDRIYVNKISGPASWDYNLVDILDSAVTFYWLEEGVYEFELTLQDRLGLSDNDTFRITVNNNFRKYIQASLFPDLNGLTTVELPNDISQNMKWVFCRASDRVEHAVEWVIGGFGEEPEGWTYQRFSNKLLFYHPTFQKFDLIVYY